MSYTIAGIDVHKKVLVVVVGEVTEQGEWSYERGTFGATAYELQRLANWFQQRGVQEVVMSARSGWCASRPFCASGLRTSSVFWPYAGPTSKSKS